MDWGVIPRCSAQLGLSVQQAATYGCVPVGVRGVRHAVDGGLGIGQGLGAGHLCQGIGDGDGG